MNPEEQLPDKPDKATILALLQLLRKYNLKVALMAFFTLVYIKKSESV